MYLSASVAGALGSFTVTLIETSSLDPSGYVTTTVASFSPGVVVSTGVLNSKVVPSGSPAALSIEPLASGVSPLLTFCSFATGVYLSASDGTVTLTGTSSLDPSGYVTTTVASFSPGVVVSTGVLNSKVVPSGSPAALSIEPLASGVSPLLTFCSFATGVYLSASLPFTVTLTGTSSLVPSG